MHTRKLPCIEWLYVALYKQNKQIISNTVKQKSDLYFLPSVVQIPKAKN